MKRRVKIMKKVKPKARVAAKPRRDAAWKCSERDVCRYFGTERAPVGQKGHDTREVPEIGAWLALRDRAMAIENFDPAPTPDAFTHVFIETKCQKQLLPFLERWHGVVQGNPDKKVLRPLMICGEIGDTPLSRLIGVCRLEDLPRVYRGFIAPPRSSGIPSKVWFANLLNRFWVFRTLREAPGLVYEALQQSADDALAWKKKRTTVEDDSIRPISFTYLTYPKRLTPAVAFRLPS
jgi:hypothetical protein